MIPRWLFVPAAVMIAWLVAARIVDQPRVVPQPLYVIQTSLPSIAVFDGNTPDTRAALRTLGRHTMVTLTRIAIGVSIGLPIAIAAAIIARFTRGLGATAELIVRVARSIPLFSFVPLSLYAFGGDAKGVYAYIAFGVFVVAFGYAFDAFARVPAHLVAYARVLGASRMKVITSVAVPAIVPAIFEAMRQVLGMTWALSLGAELLSSGSGLGFLMYQSYLYADMGKLIVITLLYALFGVLSFAVYRLISNQFV
jgi:sulfonate transport system permease protein